MQKKSNSDLSVMLLDTPETYYWTGFILADGHINNRNDLSITLSSKDEDHLKKFGEYIKCPNTYTLKNYGKICYPQVRLNVTDQYFVKKYKEKFDIRRDKTYYPPDLSWIKDKDLFLSMLAGYIDGDGTVELNNVKSEIKPSNIRFHVHEAWIDILILFRLKLLQYYNYEISLPSIGVDGYSRWCISDFRLQKEIKKDVLRLNLPVLTRKWDKINFNYTTQKEKESFCEEVIRNNPEKTPKQLSEEYKIKIHVIYRTARRMKNVS